MQFDRATAAGSKVAVSGPSAERRSAARSILVRCLCHLARWARCRSAVHTPADLLRTTDENRYRSWRFAELKQQLARHFDGRLVTGSDVLDFGCGSGELCSVLSTYSPKSLLGMDKSIDATRLAAASVAETEVPHQCLPRFICNDPHDQLPVESESVDLICCFDAVEHIPDLEAVASEWRRVLRSGGRVWILWSPWCAPYGHHLESLMPLPWIHLVLPERVIFEACAELYDGADFIPRKWDLDPVTGAKKPNKWRHVESFYPFLNRLTRRQFERIIGRAGLTIERRETHGFGGSRLRRATRTLLPVPVIGECCVSFYIYELAKGVSRWRKDSSHDVASGGSPPQMTSSVVTSHNSLAGKTGFTSCSL
jgi:SAM-dependent methyltransferase